jgi:glycosyltransferase involved in cell wall biosynthesis
MERNAYKRADIVTVHSEGNQKMLLQRHPQIQPKLKILHNWVDIDHHNTEDQTQDPNAIDFREKWNIRQRFVAVFAGVMGPSQYLDLVLEVAAQMQDQDDLMFLLVGDGKEKKRLQELTKSKNLRNVRFENFVSREAYPYLLRACSIGLVCLSPENKTPVVPGKILGHMATGLPVAAFLHAASDGHQLIADAACGFSADSSDLNACVHVMRRLMNSTEKFKEIGASGHAYAEQNFSKEVCVSGLETMISN